MFSFLSTIVCLGDPRLNGMRGDGAQPKAPSVLVLGPDGKPTYNDGYLVLTPGPDLTGDAKTSALAYETQVKAILQWLGNDYLAKKYGYVTEFPPVMDDADIQTWEIQKAVMVFGITQLANVLPAAILNPTVAEPGKPAADVRRAAKPRDLRAELKALPPAERSAFLASLPAAERDALLSSLLG